MKRKLIYRTGRNYHKLCELYELLPDGSKDLFKRLYGSIHTIDEKKVKTALRQCERTLAKMK